MKDDTQSIALVESRTLNKSGAREIETIEIIQPGLSLITKKLQLAFLVDNTGSQQPAIESVKALANDVATLLSYEFETIEFALMQFKDEDETSILTGSNFVSLATFQTEINTLLAAGGGDSPENGFGAVVMSATLPWDVSGNVARAIFLTTDIGSHERGATQQQALSALEQKGIVLFYKNTDLVTQYIYTFVGAGSGNWVYNTEFDNYDFAGAGLGDYSSTTLLGNPDIDILDYHTLTLASGGARISPGTAAEVADEFTDLLKVITVVTGVDPIFICNDNAPFSALDEDGRAIDFLPRAFAVGVSVDGTNGTKSINLTVDNSDLAVSRYLSAAIKNNLPAESIYRLYLSNDDTGPQTNPPLRLFLSDVEISGSTVSGALGWVNLVDAPFPNQYYDRSKFPSL